MYACIICIYIYIIFDLVPGPPTHLHPSHYTAWTSNPCSGRLDSKRRKAFTCRGDQSTGVGWDWNITNRGTVGITNMSWEYHQQYGEH